MQQNSPPRRHGPIIGACQWFHFQERRTLDRSVRLMRDLGIRHIRTGISWADYHRPGGRDWYRRQLEALNEFDVLLSIWHTPPSIAEAPACSAPPRRLQDYADFIDTVITEFGDHFNDLELWNEPNNRYKWNFPDFDPQWRKFGEMVACAANWARQRGRRTVLGGMIPVDHHWLQLMEDYGALQYIDVVAIHGFPGMWWSDAPNWEWYAHWRGWADKVAQIRSIAGDRPIWVTETGLATWNMETKAPGRWQLQSQMIKHAAAAPVERVYWYSLIDLDPSLAAIEGFHVDENEYHLGVMTWSGRRKPAAEILRRAAAAASGGSAVLRPRARGTIKL